MRLQTRCHLGSTHLKVGLGLEDSLEEWLTHRIWQVDVVVSRRPLFLPSVASPQAAGFPKVSDKREGKWKLQCLSELSWVIATLSHHILLATWSALFKAGGTTQGQEGDGGTMWRVATLPSWKCEQRASGEEVLD